MGDVPEGEAFASDTQIVRWASDPAGRLCQITAEVPGSPEFPMFTPDASDGLVARLMVRRANRLIEKRSDPGQRRRTGPPTWYLAVWRREDSGETLLLDEVSDADEAQRRVDVLAEQVAAGTLGESN
jgi:hypothetical protein